jgi:hypothetical protein
MVPLIQKLYENEIKKTKRLMNNEQNNLRIKMPKKSKGNRTTTRGAKRWQKLTVIGCVYKFNLDWIADPFD